MTRRNRWKWALLSISVFFFISSFSFFVIYGLLFRCPQNQTVCRTEECIVTGSQVLQKLDQEEDPCEDFYQFACGRYLQNEPIPDDEDEWSTIRSSTDSLLFILNRLLQTEQGNITDARTKAKIFYETCIRENRVNDEEATTALHKSLSEEGVEDWPILDPYWNRNDINLEKRLAVLTVFQVMPFFDVELNETASEMGRHILKVKTGRPLLDTEFYLSFERNRTFHLQLYREFMFETLRHLGVAEDTARRDVNDMIAFETRFANVTQVHEARRESMENLTTHIPEGGVYYLSQLDTIMPEIDWTLLFRYLCENLNASECNIRRVNLESIWSMQDLLQLLENTPRRTLANYMIWRVLYRFMYQLHGAFRRLHLDFVEKHLNSIVRHLSMWKECSETVHNGMFLATTSLFIQHEFDGDKNLEVHRMVTFLKKTFVELLKWQKQVSKDQREQCVKMIQNMDVILGYVKMVFNVTTLNEYFDNLEMKDDHFIKNVLRYNKFVFSKKIESALMPQKKKREEKPTTPVNDKLNVSMKNISIALPLETLLQPFFGRTQQRYQNYGMIGTYIGHEMMRALTHHGKPLFEFGQKWKWPEKIENNTFARVNCFSKKVPSNYTDDIDEELKLSAEEESNTLKNERIGLQQAYLAYQKYGPKSEPALPGLDFDNRQMFFIMYAQTMCETKKNEVTPDDEEDVDISHRASRYRVNQVLESRYFKEAFQCKDSPKKKKKT